MKKGISLIVLVITIIVMIILAASVVITLSNTGVIDRASHAVDLTNERQVQDMAALIWAEAYMDETRTDTIEKVVKDKLAEQGITSDKWDITVSDNGVSIKAKGESNLITFKVRHGTNSSSWNDDTDVIYTYTAEPGMTWGEFAESEYNDGKIYVSNLYMKSSLYNCPDYITTTIGDGSNSGIYGIKVEPDDVIVDGATYGGECD